MGGPSGASRRIRAVTRHLVAVGQQPRLLGDAGAGARPVERRVVAPATCARRCLVSESTSSNCCPDHLRAVDAEQPLRGPVDQRPRSVAVEDDDAVGQGVDAPRPDVRSATSRQRSAPSGGRRRYARLAPRADGVEAQGGGGGEVEALGAAVDRDADPVVGQRGDLGRAGPRPRCRTARPYGRASRSPASSRDDLAGAVGGEHGQPGVARGGGHGGRDVRLDGDRQVEQAADAGPDGLGVVGVDGASPPARRRRRRPRRRVRITVPALPGSRTSAQMATSRAPVSASASGDVEEAADGHDARPG